MLSSILPLNKTNSHLSRQTFNTKLHDLGIPNSGFGETQKCGGVETVHEIPPPPPPLIIGSPMTVQI